MKIYEGREGVLEAISPGIVEVHFQNFVYTFPGSIIIFTVKENHIGSARSFGTNTQTDLLLF